MAKPGRKKNSHTSATLFSREPCLYERQLVGGDVEGIDVRGEAGVGLLGTIGAVKGSVIGTKG